MSPASPSAKRDGGEFSLSKRRLQDVASRPASEARRRRVQSESASQNRSEDGQPQYLARGAAFLAVSTLGTVDGHRNRF